MECHTKQTVDSGLTKHRWPPGPPLPSFPVDPIWRVDCLVGVSWKDAKRPNIHTCIYKYVCVCICTVCIDFSTFWSYLYMDTCDQLSFGIFHPFPSFERPTCCEPTWLYPLREMLWVELAHETWGPILSMLCHVRGLAEWAHIACHDVSTTTTTTTSAASTVVSQNMSELRVFILNHLCDYSLVSCMFPSL